MDAAVLKVRMRGNRADETAPVRTGFHPAVGFPDQGPARHRSRERDRKDATGAFSTARQNA